MTRHGLLQPLEPHQEMFLDRALFVRRITWEQEQERLKYEAMSGKTQSGNHPKQHGTGPARGPKQSIYDVDVGPRVDLSTGVPELDYAVTWDGSHASGLKFFGDLKPIDPDTLARVRSAAKERARSRQQA